MVSPGNKGSSSLDRASDIDNEPLVTLRQLAELDIEHGVTELLSESLRYFSSLTTGVCVIFEARVLSRDLELIVAGSSPQTRGNPKPDSKSKGITIAKDSRVAKTLHGKESVSLSEIAGESSALQSLRANWCNQADLLPIKRGATLYGLALIESNESQPTEKELAITMAAELGLLCEVAELYSSARLTSEVESMLDAPLMIIDTNNGSFERTNQKARIVLGLESATSRNAFDLISGLHSLIELLRKSQNSSSVCKRSDRITLKGVNYSVFGALIVGDVREKALIVLFELPAEVRETREVHQMSQEEDHRVRLLSKQLLVERQSRQMISKIYSFLDSDAVLQTLVDGLGMALGCQRCIVAKMPDQASPVVTYEYAEPDISPLGLGRMTQFPKNIYNLLLTGVTCLPDVSSLRGTSGILPQDINNLLQNGISSLMGA
ncbi:MAG: hypothetical protein K2Z81_14795, partial [Cyanobacteria bacterium]|nr:hypothetical protein [Cyanobacteriota bacterium]